MANTVLGSIPPFYVTEIGYALSLLWQPPTARAHATNRRASCRPPTKCSSPTRTSQGIWWYQSHDDSTGDYGFMTKKNRLRPAFRVLSAIGQAVGQ